MAYDLPIALEALTKSGRILPTDDWGPCAQTGTPYADFAAKWRGVSAVPTEAELQAAYDAAIPTNAAAKVTVERATAKTRLQTAAEAGARADRAIVVLTVDEINRICDRLQAQDAAIASATSLANLKALWAALPAIPDRTLQQARTALHAAIDGE
jgi:hypothetical protein